MLDTHYFLEDGHGGDADDNRDDDRGCLRIHKFPVCGPQGMIVGVDAVLGFRRL